MEQTITVVIEALILICTAIGGFRQAVLKPYFSHRDAERKWREKYEEMRDAKNKEREHRQDERAKILGDKYDQLVDSISKLAVLVDELRREQNNIIAKESAFSEHFRAIEDRLEVLQGRLDKFSA